MLKLALIDTETTGLKKGKHSMVQLSGFIVINGKITDEFNYNLRPIEGRDIEPEALEVNKLTPAILASYPDPKVVMNEVANYFKSLLNPEDEDDKLTICSFNAPFDAGFLEESFKLAQLKDEFKSIFERRKLDIMSLAISYMDNYGLEPKNGKYSQINCAKAIGIDIDTSKSHEAFYDASIAYLIYKKIRDSYK